jgi:hypothetical protein
LTSGAGKRGVSKKVFSVAQQLAGKVCFENS